VLRSERSPSSTPRHYPLRPSAFLMTSQGRRAHAYGHAYLRIRHGLAPFSVALNISSTGLCCRQASRNTRAVDGTQTAESPGGFAATWTFHPDDGLNIIIEKTPTHRRFHPERSSSLFECESIENARDSDAPSFHQEGIVPTAPETDWIISRCFTRWPSNES